MHYWSMYRKQDVLNPDSECAELLTVGGVYKVPMPNPREVLGSTGSALLFTDYLPNAAEPLIVELTEDNSLAEIAAQIEAAEIAAQIEAYLDNNDTRCIWLTKGLASQLYESIIRPLENEIE